MAELIVWPLDLDEVRDRWITRDEYGRLCGKSHLFTVRDANEVLEGLRHARSNIHSLVAEVERLREQVGEAVELIDGYDGPDAPYADHGKWADVRAVLTRDGGEPGA